MVYKPKWKFKHPRHNYTISNNNIINFNGSITNLYSNILSVNNGTALRSANDLFNVSISSTSNYLYFNNSSVLGLINTSNSNNSWLINGSGNAQFPSLNVKGVSSLSTLAVNSSAVRGSGDLLTVSVTPSGDYLYLNNAGTLGIYRSSGNPSYFPWTIDTVGLGTFRTVSTTIANITTDNVGTLNVSGTATINKVSINSTMRSSNDLLNVSSSSTGPYLFIGGDVTIGTYNTNNSTFPWFVEMDGDATFSTVNSPTISTPHLKATGKIKRERVVDSATTYNVTNSTTSLRII